MMISEGAGFAGVIVTWTVPVPHRNILLDPDEIKLKLRHEARPLRFEYPGAIYRVMACGDGGIVIFIEKE